MAPASATSALSPGVRARARLSISTPGSKAITVPSRVSSCRETTPVPAPPSPTSVSEQVVLARPGVGVPWFCFPALAGTATPYLASIVPGPFAPVYLLEAPGLDGATPLESLEALAQRFVAAIQSVAPAGSVRLVGWSLGAATAFMAACELSRVGRSVEELVLVDPAVPGDDAIDQPLELARALGRPRTGRIERQPATDRALACGFEQRLAVHPSTPAHGAVSPPARRAIAATAALRPKDSIHHNLAPS